VSHPLRCAFAIFYARVLVSFFCFFEGRAPSELSGTQEQQLRSPGGFLGFFLFFLSARKILPDSRIPIPVGRFISSSYSLPDFARLAKITGTVTFPPMIFLDFPFCHPTQGSIPYSLPCVSDWSLFHSVSVTGNPLVWSRQQDKLRVCQRLFVSIYSPLSFCFVLRPRPNVILIVPLIFFQDWCR